MPAALQAVKISKIQPTQEELAEARRNIAALPPNKILSQKMSMKQFLAKHPDMQAEQATGIEKTRMLELFHIHVSRCKAGQKRFSSEHSIKCQKKLHQTLHWWSEEQMDQKLGPKKALHWRESKVLPTRPDRVTKSSDRWLVEYGCPEDWEQYTEEQLRELKTKVESELEQEDIDVLNAQMKLGTSLTMSLGEGPKDSTGAEPSTGSSPPIVTDAQIMATKMESLKANRKATLLRYQEKIVQLKMFKSRGDNLKGLDAKLAVPFIEALGEKIKRGNILVKTLERLLVENPKDESLPKLIDSMEFFDESYAQAEEYADRFNCGDPTKASTPPNKKRKTKKEE